VTIDESLETTGPIPVIGAEPDWASGPTRRARRLAARAMARVDGRGPRTGEFEISDAARRARLVVGLPAELPATTRWRRRQWRFADNVTVDPLEEQTGRHRGD
jgi:hypothetical protein